MPYFCAVGVGLVRSTADMNICSEWVTSPRVRGEVFHRRAYDDLSQGSVRFGHGWFLVT